MDSQVVQTSSTLIHKNIFLMQLNKERLQHLSATFSLLECGFYQGMMP
jgi:hypothetical protein